MQRCFVCSIELEENVQFCLGCGASVQAKALPRDPLLGRVLLNQFVLREQLGSGGFGAVYKAYQPAFDRYVAVKILHRHLCTAPQIAERFQREAKAAAKLTHRSAVSVFASGDTEDGLLWMAMEFLEGKTLDVEIKEQRRLSTEQTITLLLPICEVLQEAHELGIIHRDLKPQNILLARDKKGNVVPKLLDFGIAAVREEAGNMTGSAQIMGTPQYMSPEHWQGARHTDARSDIYAMGIILYQCVSGRLPFEADTPMLWMQKHNFEQPRELESFVPDVSLPLQAVISRCLAKEPAQRYTGAEMLATALQRVLSPSGNAPRAGFPIHLLQPTLATAPTLAPSPVPMTSEIQETREPQAREQQPTKHVETTQNASQGGVNPSSNAVVKRGISLGVLVVASVLLLVVLFVFWPRPKQFPEVLATETTLASLPTSLEQAQSLATLPTSLVAASTQTQPQTTIQTQLPSKTTQEIKKPTPQRKEASQKSVIAGVPPVDPDDVGTIDKGIVLAGLKEGLPTLRTCYETALATDASLPNRAKVRFVITAKGTVRSVNITESISPEVDACLVKGISRLRFPAPDGGNVTVVFPLRFQ